MDFISLRGMCLFMTSYINTRLLYFNLWLMSILCLRNVNNVCSTYGVVGCCSMQPAWSVLVYGFGPFTDLCHMLQSLWWFTLHWCLCRSFPSFICLSLQVIVYEPLTEIHPLLRGQWWYTFYSICRLLPSAIFLSLSSYSFWAIFNYILILLVCSPITSL